MTLEKCFDELGRRASVDAVPMTPEALACDETSDPAMLCADPQVSVFIPMYNLGPRLDEALAGVMAQDADSPFEVVLCDDCSTDDTVALAEAWVRRCPEKVRLLRARQNAGALRNRLRAQRYCRAPWIALLDGDDLWTDPGKLRKQLPLLRKTGTVMAVAFSEVLLPDDKREVYTCPIAPFVTPKVFVNRYLQTSTYVYSRAAAEEALRRWPGLPIWDDLDIYYPFPGPLPLRPSLPSPPLLGQFTQRHPPYFSLGGRRYSASPARNGHFGSRPRPLVLGRSPRMAQTPRSLLIGSLEAWLSLYGALFVARKGVLFSVLCSPGAKAPSPCRGVGQRPTPSNQLISQSPNQPTPLVSFVIPKTHWQSLSVLLCVILCAPL